MSADLGPRQAEPHAARAWAHRWAVEEHAKAGFLLIARGLEEQGYPDVLVVAAHTASEDERDHAARCRTLTVFFGGEDLRPILSEAEELAPRALSAGDRLLYESVARCCIAETESAATLAELSGRAEAPVLSVIRIIARDEVRHARLGWAILGFARARGDVAFLGAHLPAMLATGGAPLFEREDDGVADVPALGVYSRATKRALFCETLETVIFPSLEEVGVPTAAARSWLAVQIARVDGLGPNHAGARGTR